MVLCVFCKTWFSILWCQKYWRGFEVEWCLKVYWDAPSKGSPSGCEGVVWVTKFSFSRASCQDVCPSTLLSLFVKDDLCTRQNSSGGGKVLSSPRPPFPLSHEKSCYPHDFPPCLQTACVWGRLLISSGPCVGFIPPHGQRVCVLLGARNQKWPSPPYLFLCFYVRIWTSSSMSCNNLLLLKYFFLFPPSPRSFRCRGKLFRSVWRLDRTLICISDISNEWLLFLIWEDDSWMCIHVDIIDWKQNMTKKGTVDDEHFFFSRVTCMTFLVNVPCFPLTFSLKFSFSEINSKLFKTFWLFSISSLVILFCENYKSGSWIYHFWFRICVLGWGYQGVT